MVFYTMIGFIVVASIIAAGVYWVISNVTLTPQPDRYTYVTDKDGNESVNTNSKGEPNEKA